MIQHNLNLPNDFEKYLNPKLLDFNKKIDLQWFAAEDEGRTEDPTDYKIKKAREEGRVAKSQDLNAAMVVLLPVITLIIMGPYIFRSLLGVIAFFFERCTTETIFSGAWFHIFIITFFKTVFPITAVAMISGILGNIIQNKGFLFSTKTIKPDFKKIAPNFVKFFKKVLFSAQGLFNLAKSLFKLVIIGFIGYIVISSNLTTMISMLQTGFADSVFFIAKLAAKILIYSAVVLVLLSIPDYFFQKKQFKESLKMAKYEVKDEYKELEGDPMVKAQINRQMQAILQKTGVRARDAGPNGHSKGCRWSGKKYKKNCKGERYSADGKCSSGARFICRC